MSFINKELKYFLEIYQRIKLRVIPLAPLTKVPPHNFKLADIYEGKDYYWKWEEWKGNIGIVTGFENFCVIDCDSQEAIEWFENLEEFIPTAIVKTRRGHHYWYCVYDAKIEDRKSHSIQQENFKIDILFGNKYVVAPPSEIREAGEFHKYVFIDGYDPVKKRLQISLMDIETLRIIIEKAYKKAGRTISIEKIYEKLENIEISEKEEKENIEKFLKIIELCKNFYYEGNRQNIWLGLAGLGRKLGLHSETIKNILTKELYENFVDNERLEYRQSTIDYTFQKKIEEVAGISLLAERVFDAETIEEAVKILKPQKYQVITREEKPFLTEEALTKAKRIVKIWNKTFALVDNYWYVLSDVSSKKGNEKNIKYLKPVAAGFFIKEKGFDIKNQKPVYIAYHLKEKREGEIELDPISLKNFLNLPILDYKNLDYLWTALLEQRKEKKFISELGWFDLNENKKLFIHPLNNSFLVKYNLFCYLDNSFKAMFWYNNTEKQHEIVRNLLEEGKILGAMIVFSACSLFLNPRQPGFTVFCIGPRGIGKTTSAQFIISLFYDCNSPLTWEATLTGMELYLRRFKNLPVLFDETTLSRDKALLEFVYMLGSGVGKLRGTKKLSIDIGKIYSIVFVTGEREPDFPTRGAERRSIIIFVTNWEEYTNIYNRTDLRKTFTSLQGVGFDWIKWLEENQNFEEREELKEEFTIFSFYESIERALAFLKNYYQLQNFDKLKETIEKILYDQFERVDVHFKRLLDNFTEFLLKYATNFIISGLGTLREPQSGQIFGAIDVEKNKLFLRTEVMRKFCEEAKIDLRTALLKLEEKGILLPNIQQTRRGFLKRWEAKPKRIKYQGQSFVVSVYEFDLEKISEEFKDQLISETMKVEPEKSILDDLKNIPF